LPTRRTEADGSAFLRMSEQAPFHLYTAFALTYIEKHLNLAQGLALGAVSVGGAIELFLTPVSGHLSDRPGRRRTYVTGAVLIAVVAFPAYALFNTKTAGLIILGIALFAIAHAISTARRRPASPRASRPGSATPPAAWGTSSPR
jgi:MFS family permease